MILHGVEKLVISVPHGLHSELFLDLVFGLCEAQDIPGSSRNGAGPSERVHYCASGVLVPDTTGWGAGAGGARAVVMATAPGQRDRTLKHKVASKEVEVSLGPTKRVYV